MTIEITSQIDTDTVRSARTLEQQALANQEIADALELLYAALRAVITRGNEFEDTLLADGSIELPDGSLGDLALRFADHDDDGLYHNPTDEDWFLVSEGATVVEIGDTTNQARFEIDASNDQVQASGTVAATAITGNVLAQSAGSQLNGAILLVDGTMDTRVLAGISGGTYASVWIDEPDITVNTTNVDNGVTLYVAGIPTEGTVANYSILDEGGYVGLRATTPEVVLETTDTVVASAEVLSRISTIAPSEASGGDALLEAGAIEFVAEADFGATQNKTGFVVKLGSSEAATEKFRVTNEGGIQGIDGIATPATRTGFFTLYVDTSDGDFKIKYGDGTVKTIVVDT